MTISLVAYGTNLPSDEYGLTSTVDRIIDTLGRTPRLTLREVSRCFRSPAWPPGSGPDFLNGAFCIDTGMDLVDLLGTLHEIEASLGRTRKRRWEPRICDLDLIAAEDAVLPDPASVRAWMELDDAKAQAKVPDGLILPHPRMHRRGFVLLPLCDIAPDWRHPVLGLTVREMADALSEEFRAGVVPLEP